MRNRDRLHESVVRWKFNFKLIIIHTSSVLDVLLLL